MKSCNVFRKIINVKRAASGKTLTPSLSSQDLVMGNQYELQETHLHKLYFPTIFISSISPSVCSLIEIIDYRHLWIINVFPAVDRGNATGTKPCTSVN